MRAMFIPVSIDAEVFDRVRPALRLAAANLIADGNFDAGGLLNDLVEQISIEIEGFTSDEIAQQTILEEFGFAPIDDIEDLPSIGEVLDELAANLSEPRLIDEIDDDGKVDFSVKPTCSVCSQIPRSLGGICSHFDDF